VPDESDGRYAEGSRSVGAKLLALTVNLRRSTSPPKFPVSGHLRQHIEVAVGVDARRRHQGGDPAGPSVMKAMILIAPPQSEHTSARLPPGLPPVPVPD
jgi:hypothetical protein